MGNIKEAIRTAREITQEVAQEGSEWSRKVNNGIGFVIPTFILTQAEKLNSDLKKNGY